MNQLYHDTWDGDDLENQPEKSLPDYIQSYMETDEFKNSKAEFDARFARNAAFAAPILEAVDGSWRKLEFTPEAMEIQGNDPDIAFQCEWENWVIRADYSDEIGDSMWFWEKGSEDSATEEWCNEFFAHGTPGPPITSEEREEFGWVLENAIRSFAFHRCISDSTTKTS